MAVVGFNSCYMRNDEYLKEVGMLFRLELTRQRLTQQMVTDKSGLNDKTVQRIETGSDAGNILTLKKMAGG